MIEDYKKCLVLGSTSFAGAWFVREALDRGLQVIGVSRSPEPNSIFLPYKESSNLLAFAYHQMDVNQDNDAIIALVESEKPDVIVDFAGQGMVAPSWDWPEQWYQTNVVAKAKIQNALRKMPFIKRYIRISTPEVYGHTDGLIAEHTHYNPSTPYAVSHAAIDMNLMAYHRQYEFPVIFTRFANFYGSAQQLYRITPRALFCALSQEEKLPLHGGGGSVRAFIHAKDVADGIFACLEKGKMGEVYHFSPSEFVTIKELVQRIAKMAGCSLEDIAEVAPDRPAKDTAYFMDSSKAKNELGWEPKFTLDLGLEDTYQWVEKHLKIIRGLPKDYIHKQ